MKSSVKCINCGLLGVRTPKTGDLVEVTETIRQRHLATDRLPICAALAANLIVEHEQEYDSVAQPHSKFYKTIEKDRDCAEFRPWQPGFTPKEHIEMKMRDEHRQWQERMESKQRLTMFLCAVIGTGAALAGAAIGILLGG